MSKTKTVAALEDELAAAEKKIEKLEQKVEDKKEFEKHIREQFSKLLGSIRYVRPQFDYLHSEPAKEETVTLSWAEIAFRVGELHADANYAMTLEARDEFRRESQQKTDLIIRMKRAMIKAGVEFDFAGEELL